MLSYTSEDEIRKYFDTGKTSSYSSCLMTPNMASSQDVL